MEANELLCVPSWASSFPVRCGTWPHARFEDGLPHGLEIVEGRLGGRGEAALVGRDVVEKFLRREPSQPVRD